MCSADWKNEVALLLNENHYGLTLKSKLGSRKREGQNKEKRREDKRE